MLYLQWINKIIKIKHDFLDYINTTRFSFSFFYMCWLLGFNIATSKMVANQNYIDNTKKKQAIVGN